MTMKNSYDGYEIAQKDLAMRGPGDFLRSGDDERLRQSGGVRFKLAELCDDTGLMTLAFEEAKNTVANDPSLSLHPKLKDKVSTDFTLEQSFVN